MYIAIAGNIGSGKTTLTTKLAEHFNWEPRFESTEDNPYLKDFYGDMPRWSFHLQVYFLNSRFRQVEDLVNRKQLVIQDRSIYEDAHVFSKALHAGGELCDRDYGNFIHLFDSMVSYMPAPELLIYLKADTDKLVSQIKKRGRDYEQSISESYLASLNTLYNDWIGQYSHGKLLVIDMNDRDFVNNQDDLESIIKQVENKLNN
ncbi:deoxynucleoside kinase [Limibacter armeniacum]|uniref:deoxynucleoside kinase n=1 Tax=Limibacter armeniacum TaxID=466084 RepID=UPI002FE5AFDE